MGLLDRFLQKSDTEAKAELEEELRLETAKVRAYRRADEMVSAANELMQKAKELRAEIEAIDSE